VQFRYEWERSEKRLDRLMRALFIVIGLQALAALVRVACLIARWIGYN